MVKKFHCWEKDGHGIVNLRKGIQRSCDVYFYEVARKLGVDRLAETAKRFGLGKKVLTDFIEEKSGVVPNTKWKKKFIGQNWYLGETLHSGIGQGYFQSTPLQLCLMTAQIANGGFEIKPRIIFDKKNDNLRNYLKFKNENPNQPLPTDMLVSNFNLKPLFKNQEHINLIKDAMFSSSNNQGELLIDTDLKIQNILLQARLVHHKLKDLLKRSEKLKSNKKAYLTRIEIMHYL